MKVYCIDYCVTGIGEIDWVDVFGKGREMTLKNRVEEREYLLFSRIEIEKY